MTKVRREIIYRTRFETQAFSRTGIVAKLVELECGRKRMKKIAVVGSRKYPDLEEVQEFVEKLPGTVDLLISGGAEGVDIYAASTALARRMKVNVIGPKAPGRAQQLMERNTEIVRECTELYAFWDLRSSGTLDTIRKALKAGKLKWIQTPWGKLVFVEVRK